MSVTIRKAVTASVLAAFAVAILSFVVTTPAPAIGGTCSTRLERENNPLQLDDFRAGALCTRLNADTRAHAWLVRNGGPDYFSPWFTALNVWYWTPWRDCYAGCRDAFELAHV